MTASSPRISHAAIQTIANVVSTVVAVTALIYSTISYKNTVHLSSRDQARRDWSEFLKMASENPDLQFNDLVVYAQDEAKTEEYNRRYNVYINRMYFYMNSVIENDGVKNWKSQILNELVSHGTRQCVYLGNQSSEVEDRGYSLDFKTVLRDFYSKSCNQSNETVTVRVIGTPGSRAKDAGSEN